MTTQSDLLILSIPELVGIINSRFEELTGEKIPFVLLVGDGDKALCSSNVDSKQRELLLNRWRGYIYNQFQEVINKDTHG